MDHLSTDRGGTLTVLVAGEDEAERAADPARGAGLRRGRRAGDRRMRVEPVPRLVGHLAVPGDKSISHRAVLLGAICDGETHVAGFGRSADTESTIGAVRASGYGRGTRPRHAPRLRRRSARAPAPGRPIDCDNAGTLVRLSPGSSRASSGSSSSSRATRRSARDRWADRGAARSDGRGVETTTGAYLWDPGPAAARDRLPAARGERPGQVGDPPRRPLRDGETTVVEPAPTRDHTERMLAAAGARWAARELTVRARRAARARRGRRARRLLLRRAVHRGCDARPGLGAPHPRGQPQPAPNRAARRPRAHGRPRHRLQPARASAASRQATSRSAPPTSSPRRYRSRRSARDRRAAALCAPAACAHGNSRLRGAAELRAKETTASRRRSTRCARSGGTSRRPRTASASAACRPPRGGPIESRGDHRIAMLGAVAGLASQEGVEIEEAECVAVSFPGFFELLDRSVGTAAE